MSAISPSWSTVNVRATYRDGALPDVGSVVFTFTDRIVSATDDVIFASGASFEAKLGATTGTISVDLPCVDDPDVSPNNWSIKVEEKLKSGRGATYYIKPTLAMVASGLNLRTVLVPGSLPSPDATTRIGVPGGLAQLNADGNVVDAAGNVVLGGGGVVSSGGNVGIDTDGRPYFSTTPITGGGSVQTDTDGRPYFLIPA